MTQHPPPQQCPRWSASRFLAMYRWQLKFNKLWVGCLCFMWACNEEWFPQDVSDGSSKVSLDLEMRE